MNNQNNYQCPKCRNNAFETGEIRAAGGFWTKFFNIQNQRYIAKTCTNCGYTEFYKANTSNAENILDFFGN